MLALIDAYRAIALASSGEAERGASIFGPIELYLLATDEQRLVTQFRDAIASSAPGRAVA